MVKFKKINTKVKDPTPTPSGFDLYAPERIDIPPGQSYKIGSGLNVEIPKGFVGIFHVRSKMALKKNIEIGAQIIHHDNKEELSIHVYNKGQDLLGIVKDEAIVQIIVVPCLLDYSITEG